MDSSQSIESLPSVKELREEAKALDAAAWLLRRDDVRQISRDLSERLDELVSIVDGFYALLGEKHWVFSDALSLDRMKDVASAPSPDDAERELIAYLQEDGTLHGMINRLNRFPDMRPRLPLLRKGERDYLAGRYYSSVLVTISMMDGFVNDAFKDERRGLSARGPEEMYIDDCVATVWDGLPSVQGMFTKTCGKRDEKTVHEVYRHGIMHGMTLGYDNVVVASKAWCMLFAVADWVDARMREGEVSDTSLSDFVESARHLIESNKKMAQTDEKLSKWRPHEVDLSSPLGPDAEVLESCTSYLEAWRDGNYGKLGLCFANFVGRTPGKLAGEARESYSPHPISGYSIERLERPAAARAVMTVRLYHGDVTWTAKIPLSKLDEGTPAAEWEPGEWKVIQYGIAPFVEAGAPSVRNED